MIYQQSLHIDTVRPLSATYAVRKKKVYCVSSYNQLSPRFDMFFHIFLKLQCHINSCIRHKKFKKAVEKHNRTCSSKHGS